MNSSYIKKEKGYPALYIDNQRTLPVLFGLSDIPGSASNTHYAWKNIRNFAELGIHLVCIDAEIRQGWFKQSPYEWASIEAEIADAMAADPQTGVLIRLHMNPPYWWMRDYPEETVLYDGVPGIDDGEGFRLIRDDHNHHLRVSLASERWLNEAGERLATFCREIWDSEEGKAVAAIQVACGINGEWHQWGNDCSIPMQNRFRRLLREKYITDQALQLAWNDSTVTIDTAEIKPSPSQKGDDGIFRDPGISARIIDSQYCIQSTVPEAILYFCDIIKKNWGRPILTGAFYGYYIATGGNNAPIGGHLMPEKLYSHPELIDFLCGPAPYIENRRLEHVPLQRGLLESNRLHGVLWLTEMDSGPVDLGNYRGGDPKRFDETIALLKRNVLMPLMSGHGLWFYDHRAGPRTSGRYKLASSIYRKEGWWEKPEFLHEIRKLRELALKYCMEEYKPAADVLVVYQPQTHFITEKFVDEEYATLDAIARTGVAYDSIYLNELEFAQMSRYRCVVFPNAYTLTEEQRKKIDACTAGKQVVWLYAAGYCDGKKLSTDNICQTTGIKVKKTSIHSQYKVLETGKTYAIKTKDLTPCFAVDDPQAEVLAVYEENGEHAVVRKGSNWYFALPTLDTESMAKIMDAAGAHRYCYSSEPVLAGNGLVALITFDGGDRTIYFRNGKKLNCHLERHTTAVFDEENGTLLSAGIDCEHLKQE